MVSFYSMQSSGQSLTPRRAIMFHIGVATQHPPLPEPDQLSDLGIAFIKQCLTIDAMRRPSAEELLGHPWMIEFQEALASYEEEEIANNPPEEMPPDENFAKRNCCTSSCNYSGEGSGENYTSITKLRAGFDT